MKMVWFILISTLLHASLLALPFSRDRQGSGSAIPVTLVLSTEKATPSATDLAQKANVQPRPRQKLIKPKPVNNNRPTKKQPPKVLVKKKPPKPPSPKPLSSLAKKATNKKTPVAPARPVAFALAPRDPQKAPTNHAPEVDDALADLESAEFTPPDPRSEGASEEIIFDTASVTSMKESATQPARSSPSQIELKKIKKEINFLGNGETDKGFVGVRYAHVAKPKYPRRARRMGWEGTTLLRVLINPKGETETIVVTRSSGFSTLDKAAVKAVKRWRFHPARSGSEAVESWVKIPIVFDLEEAKN